jgi:hypothetical protein
MAAIVRAVDFGTLVPELLAAHPAVTGVRLAGSRARGAETALSDWDFAVETDDFDGLAAALPRLLAPLDPLVQQWDPLGEHPTHMLMLRGPVKLDLIFFDEPLEPRPPWQVDANSLGAVDAHFWDWILWLAAKRLGGQDELVSSQLRKMHGYLLGPLGVERAPESIEEAVVAYLAALAEAQHRLGVVVPPELREEVLPALG